jgi:hypothetical protein
MKFFFITLMILGVSCGKYEVSSVGSNTVNELRAVTPGSELSDSDRSNLAAVCSALNNKLNILGQGTSGSFFTFFAVEKDCNNNLISAGNVDVTITNQGNSAYGFKRKSDGQDFLFPNVETPSSGVFSEICSNVANIKAANIDGSAVTFVTTIGISSADCPPVRDEICVKIEKGTVQGTSALIFSRDWIRIRTGGAQGKIGFFTQRKKVTQSYCAQNEALVLEARMK